MPGPLKIDLVVRNETLRDGNVWPEVVNVIFETIAAPRLAE